MPAISREVEVELGLLHHLEALRVRLHEPVLDPVVHHLREVPCAARADVRVAVLGREVLEDRLEPLHGLVVAADHQAVAVREPPDAAAHARVDEVDALRLRVAVAALRVAEVRVAAVDDRVARVAEREQLLERVLGDLAGGDHQPERARRVELVAKLGERRRGSRVVVRVVRLHVVAALLEAGRHVAAHAAEADHPELHQILTPRDAPAALLQRLVVAGGLRADQVARNRSRGRESAARRRCRRRPGGRARCSARPCGTGRSSGGSAARSPCVTTWPLSRARSTIALHVVVARRIDERLDADVVALARLREQLLERAFRLELDVARREHLVRLVLRRLHIRLLEGVDADHRAGDRDGELPAEELLAELVRIGEAHLLVQLGAAGRPARGGCPLPCLPVDSATSCSIQRPNAPPSRRGRRSQRAAEALPELEPRVALVEPARLLHLDGALEQPRRVDPHQHRRHDAERRKRRVAPADRRLAVEHAQEAVLAGELLEVRARDR